MEWTVWQIHATLEWCATRCSRSPDPLEVRIPIILDTHDPLNLEQEFTPLLSWQAPNATLDYLPSSVFDVEVDLSHGSSTEAMIYASVRRVGVQALEFDAVAMTFKDKGIIQTPGFSFGADLTVGSGGDRRLIVSDFHGGIRVFGALQTAGGGPQ